MEVIKNKKEMWLENRSSFRTLLNAVKRLLTKAFPLEQNVEVSDILEAGQLAAQENMEELWSRLLQTGYSYKTSQGPKRRELRFLRRKVNALEKYTKRLPTIGAVLENIQSWFQVMKAGGWRQEQVETWRGFHTEDVNDLNWEEYTDGIEDDVISKPPSICQR